MNKKDIAAIRRQFKVDNDLLTISHIFNVYIRKESSEIYHEEIRPFQVLEREQQELFLTNFKKVLTGKPDVKLFDVKFEREPDTYTENHAQDLLFEGLQADEAEDWKEAMLDLAEKMVKDRQYDKDLVVTFIRGEFFKPTKKHGGDAEIEERDEVFTHKFVLCSLNVTEEPKKAIAFDYIEKAFKSNVIVDPIINLASPIGGFLYPSFTDSASDVNHVLYAAGKPNQPDVHFIEEVLNGSDIITAQEDKAVFEEIVKQVAGDELDTPTISNVYEEINRLMEDEEDDEEQIQTLDSRTVEKVLRASGIADVDTEKVQAAFQTVIDDEKYELKASNVVPNYNTKSIKIKTKVADIAISPQDLRYVRQINFNGRRCLLIEVEEDTMIEGFKLIEEETLRI
ncbi:DUF4317 domain-containing protein [Aciduricibacillus chroicocephali]|uniref:DUF4317 domain-containing protein n=1 Tax=Aciduricibacillus chroicocephali TaxID=3054939 RepID=A0ABY9KUX8_9BACI|nr:DUF4317 domain-containing protein [Bacillaceae bacterium 44XB]